MNLSWKLLKYPIPKEKRVALVKLYYELCVTPGMPVTIIGNCLETLLWLVRSKKKLGLDDLRLSWKPAYAMLKDELFLSRRQYEIRCGLRHYKFTTVLRFCEC
jgi:proteasome activator subunit 4